MVYLRLQYRTIQPVRLSPQDIGVLGLKGDGRNLYGGCNIPQGRRRAHSGFKRWWDQNPR